MTIHFEGRLDQLRVGIDMDGVLADFNRGWIDRYNRDFGTSLDVSHVTAWEGLHHLTHFDTMAHFWEWAQGDGHSIFRDSPPLPGAIESLDRIGRDHRLVIVSSKFNWAIPDSLGWLAEHGVAAREVHFLWHKTKVPCDVFLDDAPHRLKALVASRPDATVCRMVQAWNAPIARVFDDGVTSRLAEDRYLMTTTTGNAASVYEWLEEWLQTEWPELRVHATSVTEQWATIAVVGPRSRDLVRELAPELAVEAVDFAFMTWRDAEVAGVPARVFRISFSGELAYEINVPAWYGPAVWEAVMATGVRYGITPYGTEAMHVLRAEKGFAIVGQETDGTVTPLDLGMEWIVSKKKSFVGKRAFARSDTSRKDRRQLVGLLPVDPDALLPEGAQLVFDPDAPVPMPMVGHVTSSYQSAALGRTFALAMVEAGRSRIGTTVHAPLRDRTIAATIHDAVLFDPENERRDGEPDR